MNQTPSQRIYVKFQKSQHADIKSFEDELLSHCRSNINFVTSKVITLLAAHLRSQHVSCRHRFGFLLVDGKLSSKPISPPAISINAITSPPNIPRVRLSQIKFLETREIRKNVRIVKFENRKCLFKSVRYETEAVAMSFEISNYKRLMEKRLNEWIPELIGVVYVLDEHTDDSEINDEDTYESVFEDERLGSDDGANGELHNENVHYIGALFEYFPQRDLTLHYGNASMTNKLNWMDQILTAVAALEAADFEHWDLKCENIVVDTSMIAAYDKSGRRLSSVHPTEQNPGRLKIIDLENSKASPAWQPPDSPVQPRTINISMTYALGKTILELFLGKVPAEGNVKEDVLTELPEVVRKVVKACCEERFWNAKQVLEMVKAIKAS